MNRLLLERMDFEIKVIRRIILNNKRSINSNTVPSKVVNKYLHKKLPRKRNLQSEIVQKIKDREKKGSQAKKKLFKSSIKMFSTMKLLI